MPVAASQGYANKHVVADALSIASQWMGPDDIAAVTASLFAHSLQYETTLTMDRRHPLNLQQFPSPEPGAPPRETQCQSFAWFLNHVAPPRMLLDKAGLLERAPAVQAEAESQLQSLLAQYSKKTDDALIATLTSYGPAVDASARSPQQGQAEDAEQRHLEQVHDEHACTDLPGDRCADTLKSGGCESNIGWVSELGE